MPQELGLLREEVEAWFDKTCRIYTVTYEDDEYGGVGGQTEVEKAVVPCEVIGGVGQNQRLIVSMTEREREYFTVTVPADTDVEVDDHLDIVEDGLHLVVTAVYGPESLELERQVIAYRGTDVT